jgi:hypothetical protein
MRNDARLHTLSARWSALSRQEKRRTIEAVATLLEVRLILGFLPFARALRLLRVAQAQGAPGRIAVTEAADIARAISRAARHVPFRAVCLQQAFAALLMLRRRGLAATVHLGAKRDPDLDALIAHAWCCCGMIPVTGFPVAHEFAAVARFGT